VITIVKVVVVEAVRKVEIPRLLRDFQAEWEPRFSGVSAERLFHSFSVPDDRFSEKFRAKIV
jgi:CRISPR/Cas system type I-B associated protein Csh2 (Cas7 group RAMP superfamily)